MGAPPSSSTAPGRAPGLAPAAKRRGVMGRRLALPCLLLGLLLFLLAPAPAHAHTHAAAAAGKGAPSLPPTARRRDATWGNGKGACVEGRRLDEGQQQQQQPSLPLVARRGGGGDSGSLLGRILRAWRGSVTPVGKKGGVLSRLRRFVKALWTGKAPAAASGKGGVGGSKIKASGGARAAGGGKAQGRIDKHLGKAYKRGNANFRIQKELRDWLANPMENIQVAVGDNLRVWVVTLTGAKGTIYAGEKYKLKFTFPMDYPSKPPSVYFLQPTPRHEHVYTNGDICLNLLGRDWRPNMSASTLALSILSMLSSAKEKKIPQDNHVHADNPPGKAQENWLYHDDKC